MSINNGTIKRGSFFGEPEGFVDAPAGSIFRRYQYQYKILLPGNPWTPYSKFYYEPSQVEYDKDSKETLWIKFGSGSTGWTKLIPPKIESPIPSDITYYLIEVGVDSYLSVDGVDSYITYQ